MHLFNPHGPRRFEQERLVDIGGHSALAAEQAAWFDMQGGGGDVAPDLARRGDFKLFDGGDLALDSSRDVDVLGLDRGEDTTGLADDQVPQDLDVALDGAIDANVAVGFEGATKLVPGPITVSGLPLRDACVPACGFLLLPNIDRSS